LAGTGAAATATMTHYLWQPGKNVSNDTCLLDHLLKRDHCVCEFWHVFEDPQSLISYNLKKLIDGGLIEIYYRSNHKIYKINNGVIPVIREIIAAVPASNMLAISNRFNAISPQYSGQRTIMTKADDAHRCFLTRFTCSAAVFSTFSEELGLDPDTAKKIACGFGAGISRTGNICGAVSGALMVIGLKYGKSVEGDEAATEKTRTLVRQFISEFTAKNGSVNCTALLGYDMTTPEGYEAALGSALFLTRCPALVRDAADILERIL
jgi:C_GCAxxG_C_C family probable redox protein